MTVPGQNTDHGTSLESGSTHVTPQANVTIPKTLILYQNSRGQRLDEKIRNYVYLNEPKGA